MLTHWSYVFLVLTHWYVSPFIWLLGWSWWSIWHTDRLQYKDAMSHSEQLVIMSYETCYTTVLFLPWVGKNSSRVRIPVKNFHLKDKTVARPFYLHRGNPSHLTGKMFFYGKEHHVLSIQVYIERRQKHQKHTYLTVSRLKLVISGSLNPLQAEGLMHIIKLPISTAHWKLRLNRRLLSNTLLTLKTVVNRLNVDTEC